MADAHGNGVEKARPPGRALLGAIYYQDGSYVSMAQYRTRLQIVWVTFAPVLAGNKGDLAECSGLRPMLPGDLAARPATHRDS